MKSYNLCDENFHDNDDEKIQKDKNQSVQTDPRPKLIPWENSCWICNTQIHTTKECRGGNILKVDKRTHVPPPIPPRNSSVFSNYFTLFSKIASRTRSILSNVFVVEGRPERESLSTEVRPPLKRLYYSFIRVLLINSFPKAFCII